MERSSEQADQTRETTHCTNKHITTGNDRCTRVVAVLLAKRYLIGVYVGDEAIQKTRNLTLTHLQDLELYQCNLNASCMYEYLSMYVYVRIPVCFLYIRTFGTNDNEQSVLDSHNP